MFFFFQFFLRAVAKQGVGGCVVVSFLLFDIFFLILCVSWHSVSKTRFQRGFLVYFLFVMRCCGI